MCFIWRLSPYQISKSLAISSKASNKILSHGSKINDTTLQSGARIDADLRGEAADSFYRIVT